MQLMATVEVIGMLVMGSIAAVGVIGNVIILIKGTILNAEDINRLYKIEELKCPSKN